SAAYSPFQPEVTPEGPSPTATCLISFGLGVAIVIAAIVEGVTVRKISPEERSRRAILEGLQRKGPRLARTCRNWVAMFGAIFVLFEMFRGYPSPQFSILLTALAIPSVLTVVNRFDYGDATFLAGALTIGFALFMPQSLSVDNMLGQVSGIGIVQ